MRQVAPGPGPEFLALQEAVAGRFSLVRELGRGGMGVVFLARDLALDRLVAIKLLPPHLAATPAARERFLREARTAAGLAHPNIVPIHSVESSGSLAFFVMGFVEGETLGERVRRAGPLSASEVMRVTLEMAWALAHAHARGIVHRDVKPDNVLLEEGSGRALVTDFGIAQGTGATTPLDGIVRGTPQYVSPEVAQGQPAEPRSDLYSLGITAWVAATGRLPFAGDSAAALLLAHVQSPVPSLRAAAPGLPARFCLAVDRALAKRAEQRWPSLEAFASEIDASRARAPMAPAPQRAFLREWERVGSEVITAGSASLVAAANAVALTVWDVARGAPGSNSILTWIFVLISVLAAGLAKARLLQAISHAGALRRRGVDHRRILAAMAREATARAEEWASVAEDERSQRGPQRWILAGTIVGSVACIPMALSTAGAFVNLAGIAGSVVLPTLALRTAVRLFAPRAREGWWQRLMRGGFGRWLFRPRGGATMDAAANAALEGTEPTAIALGAAARDLHDALPAAVRAALGPAVPALIDALESKAMAARDRADQDGAASGFVAALGALEALRLDLLRLSVGTITAPQLTAELARMREIGDAVDRQIEAREAVEDLLSRTPTR